MQSTIRRSLGMVLILILLFICAQGLAEGKIEYAFSATDLTASADKEAVEPGTAVDSQGSGAIVTFGTVTKRWKEDKGVTSAEAGKNLSGGFQFAVLGEAEVTVTVSSTGGENESAFAIVDASGAQIENNEGVRTVTGTGKQTFSYTLPAGTYQVVSPESEFNRGVRVYAITVSDTGAVSAVTEETHTFAAVQLTASADKEAIAEGEAVDAEGTGYFTASGNVVKRWKEDKGVTSVEVGKKAGGAICFTVTGNAVAEIGVSSNGGDNDSAVALLDETGAVVPNAEGVDVVHGTGKQVLTYALGAGTYRIVSPAHESYDRGARVHTITVTETLEAGEAEAREWQFRYFGVSTGGDRNVLISSGEGIEAPVSLGSALFHDDGSVAKKGGKFVADSPADGGSYYYTVIDPTAENFVFQADVTIDALNPTPDGQEGFALMARDALGEEGVSGNWMANLVSVGATKLPYGGVNTSPESACAVGVRAYTGIYTPEASDANEIAATRWSWWTEEGVARKIEAGKTYRVRLEKTDYAYIATQLDPETNEVIGSYTWYIPAKDKSALTVGSYAELDDPLTYQEGRAAYIALVAARGLNATFSNIEFATSPWNAAGWQPQPTEYVDLTANIISGSTAAGGSYELLFRANADGNVRVRKNGGSIAEVLTLKADQVAAIPVPMDGEQAEIEVEFTPDPDFAFSVFEKLSSYEAVIRGITVTQRSLGAEGVIHVSPEGLEGNGGASKEDAVDIQTALNYAAPGQTVLLAAGTYDLTGKELTVFRGRHGTEEAPITVTTEGGFATLDFGGTGRGFKVWGDWWNISFINVTRTGNGLPGMQLAGHHCIVERMNFYNNGTTGMQVSGSSADDRSLWPAYNTVKNCTAINNADKALEDADGFAAKLTCGDGNVFDGCIAAYNADDGWDLFAKVATGQIGTVTIRNSLTYMNGYLMVQPGSDRKSFTFADIACDENGTLTFGEAEVMEAGNGNGFKMGGSSLPGGHTLINSIAYENKAKGIDSNSCSDIKVYNCTSYNNGRSSKTAMCTARTATGGIPRRAGASTPWARLLRLRTL